jgi:hypothetical protein
MDTVDSDSQGPQSTFMALVKRWCGQRSNGTWTKVQLARSMKSVGGLPQFFIGSSGLT